MYAVPRVAPRDRDRVCENGFPLNKLDLFRFVLNSQKLRQTHSECVHLSSYSCRIVLQTQTSWNGTGKCGRVCTRVSFSANSFLITYKTTLLTLHDYRESQVCAATMIRTCTGKCRNSCTRCTSFKRWINVRDRVPRFSCARTVQYHAG